MSHDRRSLARDRLKERSGCQRARNRTGRYQMPDCPVCETDVFVRFSRGNANYDDDAFVCEFCQKRFTGFKGDPYR